MPGDSYEVRVVGGVLGRSELLAYVAAPTDEAETRVRYAAAGLGKGPSGWRCDDHGPLPDARGCVHAELADAASRWQRIAERDQNQARLGHEQNQEIN